jgi:hypothetical protein
MKHRNSHLLVGYWSRLRSGREAPDQTKIDPRAIKRMLPNVFILEASDTAHPIYRLAGTQLCDRFGFELRGTSFLAQWEAESRETLVPLLRNALGARQPVCMSAIGATADCAMIEVETVLAPLTFGGGLPCRFIGITQLLGDSSVLNGHPIAFERLVGSQMVCEDEPRAPTFEPPSPPTGPFEPLRSHPRAPHLRLVASREKPVTLHFEMNGVMRKLIDALEIVAIPQLTIVR